MRANSLGFFDVPTLDIGGGSGGSWSNDPTFFFGGGDAQNASAPMDTSGVYANWLATSDSMSTSAAPAGVSPGVVNAAPGGSFDWGNLFGQAISAYGQYKLMDSQIELQAARNQQMQTQLQPGLRPLSYPGQVPSMPGSSPFPGMFAQDSALFGGMSTTTLLAVGALAVGLFIYSQGK